MSAPTKHQRVFSDHDVMAWRALVRRGRVSVRFVAASHGVGYSTACAMLNGQSYGHLPGALSPEESLCPRFIATDAEVKDVRRKFRDRTITFDEIRDGYSTRVNRLAPVAVKAMLTGRSYGHLSGRIGRKTYAVLTRRLRSRDVAIVDLVSPEAVMAMRMAYDPPRVCFHHLAKEYGLSRSLVSAIVRGEKFPRLPFARVGDAHCASNKLTASEVLALRQRYRRQDPPVTLSELRVELDISLNSLGRILRGRSYPGVPEALSSWEIDEIRRGRRGVPPEVALFMRLMYQPGKVSVETIAKAHGVSLSRAHDIIIGKHYRDVPGAVEVMAKAGKQRFLTDEQVLEARRRYRSGTISFAALGKEYDLDAQAMNNAVRGLTYKNVPEAVPDDIRHVPDCSQVKVPNRRFTDEEITLILTSFDPVLMPVATLASSFGVGANCMRNILDRKSYKHVPTPACVVARFPSTSTPMTPEKVREVRFLDSIGVPSVEIARRLKIHPTTARNAITGRTFRDGPVPSKRKSRATHHRPTAKKIAPIKAVPPRLVEHDVRVDHVARLAAE